MSEIELTPIPGSVSQPVLELIKDPASRTAMLAKHYEEDKTQKVSIIEIHVKPDRVRRDFSHVMDMKKSIEKVGLLHAIVVTRRHEGGFWLICGESRFRASAMVPWMKGTVPIQIKEEMDGLHQAEAELEENLRRKDLTPIEQMHALAKIDEVKRALYGDQTKANPDGWSHKKTAEITGIEKTIVGEQIALSKKLKARPELLKRIENLPISQAIKHVKQIEEGEKVQRLAESGQITLSTDLQHTDAINYLASLASASMHVCIVDPPFGMQSLEDRREDTGVNESQSFTAKMKDDDNLSPDEALNLMSRVIPEIYRVLQPGRHLYLFFDPELTGEIKGMLRMTGFLIKMPILIWDKGRTTTPFRGYSYMSAYESIFFAIKPMDKATEPPFRLTEPSSALLRFSTVHSSQKRHVFQKPLDLLSSLIKRSTTYGEKVLDCFAGSGSTLLAAKQCGRQAFGCELDQEHFNIAQGALLEENMRQLTGIKNFKLGD